MKPAYLLTRTVVFGLIVVYVIGLFTFLALRITVGDSTWWLGFLSTFANWTFAPVLALLPLALILRARRGALLLLPVLVVALMWYAPYFTPHARAAVPEDAPRLRVATFNVWGANSIHAESAGFNAIGDWLRTLDADVILLQEVPLSQRTRENGILGLGDLYPQQIYAETDHWTRATLSRMPIVESTNHEGDIERMHFQRTVVEFAGEQVAIYTVHNGVPFREQPRFWLPINNSLLSLAVRYDPTWRDQQVGFLLDALSEETLPYIVGGDFNMSDQSLIYGDVAAVMTDSFRSAGWGFGTSWRVDVERRAMPPVLRIDYLWHSEDFVTVTSEQGPFLGSDHLPLVSTFALSGS